MRKEKQIQKLIDELSKMPPWVIEMAYLYAINYTRYGEDMKKEWVTATQKACALEQAYNKGYADALQSQTAALDIAIEQKIAFDKASSESEE